MKYAVVQIANRQYKVQEGDIVKVDFTKKDPIVGVLAYSTNGKTHLDAEYLKDVTVDTTVLGSALSRKIRVARFKSKARYDRTNGHRQPYTTIKIEKIKHVSDKEEVKETAEVKPTKEVKAKVAKTTKEKATTTKKAVKSTTKKEVKSSK